MFTLRFNTSIATDKGSFLEGRVIEVEQLDEFRALLDQGVVTLVTPSRPIVERAVSVPDAKAVRSSRSSGRKARSSASEEDPA